MNTPPRERLMPREADAGHQLGRPMPAPCYLKVTLPQMF